MSTTSHYTVLEVERIICTELFGLTFWVSFMKLIAPNTDCVEGIVYFTNKADAMKLEIGDQISSQSVLNPTIKPNNSNNTFFNK